MKTWHNPMLHQEALQRWEVGYERGRATAFLSSNLSVNTDVPVQESIVHLWLDQKLLRFRYESYVADGSRSVLINDGIQQVLFDAHNQKHKLRENLEYKNIMDALEQADIALVGMLDPVGIIPPLAIWPLNYITHAERPAIQIEGTPRK